MDKPSKWAMDRAVLIVAHVQALTDEGCYPDSIADDVATRLDEARRAGINQVARAFDKMPIISTAIATLADEEPTDA